MSGVQGQFYIDAMTAVDALLRQGFRYYINWQPGSSCLATFHHDERGKFVGTGADVIEATRAAYSHYLKGVRHD